MAMSVKLFLVILARATARHARDDDFIAFYSIF
jgi:hypothetical protein